MTPAEWFLLRADWLLALRVQQNPQGGWDVVFQLDGSYASLEDAQRVAEKHREDIEAMVCRIRGSDAA